MKPWNDWELTEMSLTSRLIPIVFLVCAESILFYVWDMSPREHLPSIDEMAIISNLDLNPSVFIPKSMEIIKWN